MKRRILATLLLLFCTALNAAEHPMEAPGFVPNKSFDFHDIDSVNTFNGNLVVRIPIGQPFRVNGGLAYGLALHYNSKAWRYWADQVLGYEPSCEIAQQGFPWWQCGTTHALPSKKANAAFGWSLSLGRLFAPGDPIDDVGDPQRSDPVPVGYLYEDPDGATHEFKTMATPGTPVYTTDGSFLRMTATDSTHLFVESRDGIKRSFEGSNVTGFFLKQITDLNGNHVDIAYSNNNLTWTITDVARTIKVYFAAGSSYNNPYQPTILQKIEVPAPDGTTATYTIQTANLTLPLPSQVSNPGNITVRVLTAIERESGGNYTFTLDGSSAGTPAYDTSTPGISGCLLHMQLPTGGTYDWGYGEGHAYGTLRKLQSPGIELPMEVRSRTVTDPLTGLQSIWTYKYQQGFSKFCFNKGSSRERFTTVTRPDGAKEISHHQFYSPENGDLCPNPDQFGELWDENDYGLPFTLGTGGGTELHSTVRREPADPTKKQFLSYERYGADGKRVMSRYVVYERDPNANAEEGNPRVLSSTTYYDDPTCTTSDCLPPGLTTACTSTSCDPSNFSSMHNFDYRNYGNYGCSVTSGKDYDGTRRDRSVCRDLPSLVTTPWLLDAPSSECTAPGQAQTLTACQDTAGALITHFNYDRTHNLVLGRRTASGVSAGKTVLGATDLLTTYTYAANGNLTEEAFVGGDCPPAGGSDCGNLPTGTIFPASTTPRYRITYDNQYDAHGALERVISKYNGFNFTLSDFKLDVASGAIKESRDGDGLLTQYRYDKIGRLVQVDAPGGATTAYTYNDGARPVNISAVTSSMDGESIHNNYDYNGLGLLWHERMKVNGADSTRTTRYDNMLRVKRTSQFLQTPTECPDPDTICAETLYDVMDRPSSARNADQYVTTYQYTGPWETQRFVPLTRNASDPKAVTTERNDAFGRLSYVKDPVDTVGEYAYDVADHLTTVTVKDTANHQQVRTFAYDRRGLLSSETHPENGTASYTYDARGHVLTRSLAGADGHDLLYGYDNAERLLQVQSRPSQTSGSFEAVKDFSFADAATDSTVDGKTDHVRGKLQTATRHNRQKLNPPAVSDVKVVETYRYRDDAGRLTDRLTDVYVDNVLKQSFAQATEFNGLGLTRKTTYPGCTSAYPQCGGAVWGAIDRTYAEGRPSSILGIAGFDYAFSGSVKSIAHTNGVTDTITPWDNGLPRPKSITVTGESVCQTPSITTQPTDQHISANARATFVVAAAGTGPLTVQWYYSTGAAVSGGTDWTLTTDVLTQTTSYYARVTGSCNGTNTTVQSSTVTAFVDTCPVPPIPTVSADVTIGFLQRTTLTAWPAEQGLIYEWYIEDDGYPVQPASTSPNYTTNALATTSRFHVRVMRTSCGSAWSPLSEFVTVHVIPAPPSNLTATVGTNSISLTWTPSASAQAGALDHQELEIMTSNGQWFPSAIPPTQGSMLLGSVSPGTAVAFRVRAVSTDNLKSAYSNVIVAVPMTLTSITAGGSVKAAPLNELLAAVNAVRLIGPGSLGALSWSNILPAGVAAPATGVPMQAAHISALRTAMDAALSNIGVIPQSYTDPGLPPETTPRLVHITELRKRVQQ